MKQLRSTVCLLARLDEPEPFVDPAPDLGEDGSGIGVLKESRLFAGVAHMFAEGGQCRGKGIDVVVSIWRRKLVLVERGTPGDRVCRFLEYNPICIT